MGNGTNYVLWAVGNLYTTAFGEPPFITCDSGDPEQIDWMDTPEGRRFPVAQIRAEIARIKSDVEPTFAYRQNRAMAYPPIGDQLDALYHAGVFPEDMAAKIAAVKSEYPKPSDV